MIKKYIFIILFILFYSFVQAEYPYFMAGENDNGISAAFGYTLPNRQVFLGEIRIGNYSNHPIKFNYMADQYYYKTKDDKIYQLYSFA